MYSSSLSSSSFPLIHPLSFSPSLMLRHFFIVCRLKNRRRDFSFPLFLFCFTRRGLWVQVVLRLRTKNRLTQSHLILMSVSRSLVLLFPAEGRSQRLHVWRKHAAPPGGESGLTDPLLHAHRCRSDAPQCSQPQVNPDCTRPANR